MSKRKDTNSGKVHIEPKISVVVPAYCEQENLPVLYSSLKKNLDLLNNPWEIIIVDDGSSDHTWNVVSSLNDKDKRVKGLKFSRNFGHQYALYAGFLSAKGEAVICMDGDMQHPPDLIPEIVDQWKKGYKIVDTVRIDHHELSLFKKITSRIYYKMFTGLSGVNLQPGMADYRLIDQQVLKSLMQFDEEGLFIRGIISWVGFPRTTVSYQCNPRHSGNSHYNLRKMIQFAIEGITSFSIIPLRIGILMGVLTSLISFSLMCYAIYLYFIGETVPGWATIIAATSFMFGILFILLGIIGEYIGRILMEVRKRPRFILHKTTGFNSKPISPE